MNIVAAFPIAKKTDEFTTRQDVDKFLLRIHGNLDITRNSSHIASRIPHVNQTEQKKWLPDVVKECMGTKIKY